MRVPLTLKINGGSLVTDRELRLKINTVEFHNMSEDQVSGTWIRRNSQEVCPLAFNDQVDLFVDGRRIFRGRARPGAFSPTGMPFKLVGAWSHLEDHTLHHNLAGAIQMFRIGDIIEVPIAEGTEFWNGTEWVPVSGVITYTIAYDNYWNPLEDYYTGEISLNWISTARFWIFSGYGALRTVQGEVTSIMSYFQDLTSAGYFDFDAVELGDEYPVFAERTVQDVKVAEALRQALHPMPAATVWWDYSGTGKPEMFVRLATLEEPVELVPGGADLTGYGVTRLDELKPSGVFTRYEINASVTTGVGDVIYAHHWPPESDPLQAGSLVQTVTEDKADGLALAKILYDDLSQDRGRGTLSVVDLDFSSGLRPGMMFVLTDPDDPELDGYKLWVQSVAWNPGTGIAQLKVGYPDAAQLSTLLDMRRWTRRVWYAPGSNPREIAFYTGA